MKLQALMIAAALATGSAFAAAPSTGDTSAAPKATTAKKSHKKTAKKKHTAAHASMRHDTHAMGASAGAPMTDLHAASRQARIDQAYANWQQARR